MIIKWFQKNDIFLPDNKINQLIQHLTETPHHRPTSPQSCSRNFVALTCRPGHITTATTPLPPYPGPLFKKKHGGKIRQTGAACAVGAERRGEAQRGAERLNGKSHRSGNRESRDGKPEKRAWKEAPGRDSRKIARKENTQNLRGKTDKARDTRKARNTEKKSAATGQSSASPLRPCRRVRPRLLRPDAPPVPARPAPPAAYRFHHAWPALR